MAAQTFGKYVVTRRLGRGGMAEVYLARDPVLERNVAIKVIYPHLSADPGFGERFCREAKVVASLRHAHIVSLYDFDVLNDQPFMVLEYLSGGTLKDRLTALHAQGKPMSLAEIAHILDPLANALDYAHARGAVHRDVKPANILFTASGEPVLTDFGISKLIGESAQISASGSVIGSPAYMSPEQAASKPVDARSDQYSLGIVLYEMATGRVPFQGDSPTAVLLQHLNDPPPPPRQFNASIPDQVQGVILKALAKSPSARFASTGELARAFGAALRGEEPAAKSVVSTGAPTVLERPSVAPGAPPAAPAQPPPPLMPTKPTSLPPSTKPASPVAPVKPTPSRSSRLTCPAVGVVIAVLVVACVIISVFALSRFLSITISAPQPTSIAQATLTRSLGTATETRASPTNTLPPATPIVTPRPSPPLFPTVAPSPTVGSFGAIIFAPGVMGSGSSTKPVDPATRFPEGVARVFTLFSVEGTLKGNQWRYERYLDGKLQTDLSDTGWDLIGPSTTWTSVWNAEGIRAGDWEFRLYVMEQLVQKGTFTIERTKPGTASFAVIRFAEGINNNQPVNPHKPTDDFKAGTTQVYAFFDAANMTKQTIWKYVWYRDGNQIESAGATKTWTGNPSEKDWSVKVSDDKGLAAGTYELKLYIEDQPVQLGTFVIQK